MCAGAPKLLTKLLQLTNGLRAFVVSLLFDVRDQLTEGWHGIEVRGSEPASGAPVAHIVIGAYRVVILDPVANGRPQSR